MGTCTIIRHEVRKTGEWDRPIYVCLATAQTPLGSRGVEDAGRESCMLDRAQTRYMFFFFTHALFMRAGMLHGFYNMYTLRHLDLIRELMREVTATDCISSFKEFKKTLNIHF